jgi:hypothetical protein
VKKLYILLLCFISFSMLSANPWQRLKEHRKPSSNASIDLRQAARADSATGFDVLKYTITLNVAQNPNTINGNVLAEVYAETNLSYMAYNLVGLSVSTVRVNGIEATYTHNQGIILIPLSVQAGETFTTQVVYSGVPQLSGPPYNVGMYFRPTSIFTISDPDAARYWWPCYDHPWDKAIVDLIITMRADWKVAANGLRESIVNNGDGTATTTWRGHHPMTTYLVCITAGDYQEIPQTAMQGELPILNFVSPGQYNNALSDLASLPDMIDYYSSLFGEYPFEKYGNATVNMSTFSAMEHQTMTTLGNFIIDGSGTYELIIAHELVHQWFGNAVSFLDFNDVWLSEGFATYGEHLWVDKTEGWQAACDYISSSYHQYYLSWENYNGPATIYNPTLPNYFAPPSYEKAASVLHMLRLRLGDAAFFQLLQTYFETYKHGNAITSEFQDLAESISGQDLSQFFNQWIFGSGIPTVSYEAWHKPATEQLKIRAMTSSPTATQFSLELPFRIEYSAGSDSLLVLANAEGYLNLFEGIQSPQQILPNHNNWTILRGLETNLPHLHTCLPASGSVYLHWDEYPSAASYLVMRRESGASQWQQLNPDPLAANLYTDRSVTNDILYEYVVRAVDAEGFYSMPSEIAQARPIHFSFEFDLLVVDETRDGNGTSINPDDAMVDGFYANALSPLVYGEWDIASQGFPPLETLGQYKIVLWHDDDLAMNQLHEAEDLLSSYMNGGGVAFISGWKTATAVGNIFWERHAPGLEVYFDNPACLISAQSCAYPELVVDQTKLLPAWNGMLPMINSFEGNFSPLYFGTMAEGSIGIGKSLGFRSNKLIFFGFPLYFMEASGVRNLLQQMIPELLAVSNADLVVPAAQISLRNYPNPFNPNTDIAFELPRQAELELVLYNLKGQKLETIARGSFNHGKHSISYDASRLSSGVYLLSLKAGKELIIKRITLMK